MRGTVKFFALLREAAGCSKTEWELEEGATVATLLDDLQARLPGLKKWRDHAWIAVNQEYASADSVLRDGDEVALFPPVSGG